MGETSQQLEAAVGALVRYWENPRDREPLLAIAALQRLSDAEVEAEILPLATDPRPAARALVPEVLRHLRATSEPDSWPERARGYASLLLSLAASETHAGVLAHHLTAFVDLPDPRGRELARRLADHDAAGVRGAVAAVLHALGCDDQASVEILIRLSRDPDDDVRSWATFALQRAHPPNAPHAHCPEVREAMGARAADPHEETRGEALVGLAMARDSRVIGLVLEALEGRMSTWLALEAAEEWPQRAYVGALSRPGLPWSAEAIAAARAACERAEG